MKHIQLFKLMAGVFLGSALLFTAACGDKGGNNNQQVVQPVNPVYPQNCIGCQPVGGNVIFTAESRDYNGQLAIYGWIFSGQNINSNYPTYPNQYGYGTTYPTSVNPDTYYGQVVSSGQMILNQNYNLGYCIIPAGTYSLNTVQPGQWGYGIVMGLGLQAIGASSLLITFNGQIASPTYSGTSTGRMFGNLQILSVNGQQCYGTITVQ